MVEQERKYWIDYVKALCMLGVYLLHSEAYYGLSDISYGYFVSPFYVNGFFLVSGYLFLRSHLFAGGVDRSRPAEIKTVYNVLFRLVIPTLVFASLIYLPKALFHSNDVSLAHYLFYVWGGVSFWFTSALAVTELSLLFLLVVTKRSLSKLFILSLILFVGCSYWNVQSGEKTAADYFPWYYTTGLIYLFITVLGGVIYRFEEKIDRMMKYGWIVVAALYAVMMIACWNTGNLLTLGLGGKCNLLGFIAIVLGSLLLFHFAKHLPFNHWLGFIGRNSIVYYFFSGLSPAVCGKIIRSVGGTENYLFVGLVMLLSLAVSTAAVWIVNKYFSFLLDIRKLKH